MNPTNLNTNNTISAPLLKDDEKQELNPLTAVFQRLALQPSSQTSSTLEHTRVTQIAAPQISSSIPANITPKPLTPQAEALEAVRAIQSAHADDWEGPVAALCTILMRNIQLLQNDHEFFKQMKPYFSLIVDWHLKSLFQGWKVGQPIPKIPRAAALEPLFDLMRPHIEELFFDFMQSPELKRAFYQYFPALRKDVFPDGFDFRKLNFFALPPITLYGGILNYFPTEKLIGYLIQNPSLINQAFPCSNILKNRFPDMVRCIWKILAPKRRFLDPIPPRIQGLLGQIRSHITSLDLSYFLEIKRSNLAQIWQLFPNLQEINLSFPGLGDEDIDMVTNRYHQLTSLNVESAFPSEAALYMIATRCPQLKSLNASGYVTGHSGLSAITEHCVYLESLALQFSDFNDRGFWKILVHCPNLRTLDLSYCHKLTDAGLRVIAALCPNLENLNLAYCEGITHAGGAAAIPQLTHLKSLNLAKFATLTNEDLEAIAAHCRDIETINLARCSQINDAGIARAVPYWQHIKGINLKECEQLTHATITSIVQHCLDIVHIDLTDCTLISDAGIEALAAGYPNLLHLYVSGCDLLTDRSVKAITEHCHKLSSLDLGQCTQITNAGIETIAQGCPELKSLNCVGCGLLTDAGIATLSGLNLEELGLIGCVQLTDASLRSLAIKCPNLREVWLSFVENYTEEGLATLATGCHNLECVHVGHCNLGDSIDRLRGRFPRVIFSSYDD